jgi:phosphoglycerate dehydrogenase-like enzyme
VIPSRPGAGRAAETSEAVHLRVAVLDDWQRVARGAADWARLPETAQVRFFHDHLTDPDGLVDRLRRFQVVVLMRERTPLPADVIARLPRLRLLVTTGRANTAVDGAAAAALGIVVCGTDSGTAPPVELTWALILACARRLPLEHERVRRGLWQSTCGMQLRGKRLGVVGLGRIGSEVAFLGRAFGMHVVAWSQRLTEAQAGAAGAVAVSKEELFATSDVVSLHLKLSARTLKVVGSRELARMKPTAVLINTARGPLVDEAALLDTLRRGGIAAAGLDVYDVEPLPAGHPLSALDNVVLSPHLGYVADDLYRLFYEQAVEDVLAWAAGEPVRVLNG